MNARLTDSLLWGVVGGGAFLVLLQGYEILTGEFADPLVKVGVALAVAAAAAATTHLARGRFADPNEQT